MSAIVERARVCVAQGLPFVLYCKPNSEEVVGVFQLDNKLYLLDNEVSGFAFVSFDKKMKFVIPDEVSEVLYEHKLDFEYFSDRKEGTEAEGSGREVFVDLVNRAIIEIEKGVFEKVVLSRSELVETNMDFGSIFSNLVTLYATAFRYVFFHPEVGFWLGATPEQLLKVEKNVLKTVALAGTQLRNDEEAVVWTEKEIHEQQVVTDFIVSSLKPFCKEVISSTPYDFEAGNVVHIKTEIEAQIVDGEIINVLNILHPTPAVCGFPKEKSFDFIIGNEGYDRGFYAGFLGEWNKSETTTNFDLYVNLRCMKYEKSALRLFVGCGITAKSHAEKEYLETVNKALTMKKII